MSLWAWLFRRRQREQELDEEVQVHLRMAAEERSEQGETPERARAAAIREFGNVALVKETTRAMWGFQWLETLLQDLRYGLRQLRRNPGFTAVAAVTLTLGIGATTAIFTVVNAVLLRPLPYPDPEQLVYVQENLENYGVNPYAGNREFAAWRNRSRTLSTVAAYMDASFNLSGGGEAERVICGLASSSFLSLLRVQPAVGRIFLPADDRPGGPPVAILSHSLWERRFGGDPSVAGKGVTLDGKMYTVVGVLPATFVVPDRFRIDHVLWLPLAESETGAGPFRTVRVIGRLKPGVGLRAANSELDTILQSTLRKGFKKSVVLSTWHDEITAGARLSLLLFLGAVSLLLLMACVNVATLLLSRAATRQKEMAVRLAVGAGRARIVQQLATESTLLALLGGLLGLGLARWGKDLLVTIISPNLPALGPIRLDWRVLGFNLGLAALTAVIFGLAPALQASRVSLDETLKESSRGATEFRSRFVLRNLLIICETALAMVLLVGAGLLFRSFLRVRGIEMGFKPENILSMAIDLAPSKYVTPHDQSEFFRQVIERVKSLHGVQSVSANSSPPLGGWTEGVYGGGLAVEGGPEITATVYFSMISSDYLRTMGIPLIKGRSFTDADREGSPSVALVNESFARRSCPGGKCLGGRIGSWIHKNDWLTIVGVVGDVRRTAEEESAPGMYLPYLQAGRPYMTLLVRTTGNPMLSVAAIRSQVASVDKDQPPHNVATLEELQASSLTPRRVNMVLLGAFATLGLILALVGIYGVVTYSASHRTHEIGIRMALGAGQSDVLKMLVGHGFKLTLIGVGLGLLGALALTRFFASLLYRIKPTDPLTFAAVSSLLTIVAVLACYIPARRATKVDPMTALRHE